MKIPCIFAGFSCILLPFSALAQEVTTFQYDAQGRLIHSTRSGGPADGVNMITCFDAAGNRTNQEVVFGGSTPADPCTPPNIPPIADPDALQLPVCLGSTINVVLNDTDPDGDTPLQVIAATGSGDVSASVASSTELLIVAGSTPGVFSIGYTIEDTRGATANGTVTVTVNPGICL